MKMSAFYDSKNAILEGDVALFDDDRKCVIEGVLFPNTQLAKDYSCESTGGILCLFEDGVLALMPFTNDHQMELISRLKEDLSP